MPKILPYATPDWEIILVKDVALLRKLRVFRYRHYVEILGLLREVADHENSELSDINDLTGLNYAAVLGDEVVGSIRINDFSQTVPTVCISKFDVLSFPGDVLNQGAFVSRAIVRPDLRNSAIFSSMTLHMMRAAVKRDISIFFIDTAGARATGYEEPITSMYKAMGFRVWRPSAHVPGIGEGAILAINLTEEFQRKGSMASAYLGDLATHDLE